MSGDRISLLLLAILEAVNEKSPCFVFQGQGRAVHSKDGNNLELVFCDGLMEEVLGGEGKAAASFGEFEFNVTHAVISAVDDFGANEPVGFAKVENEVVKFSFVGCCSGQGCGEILTRESRSNHDKGIDGESFGKISEKDAVFFGFENFVMGRMFWERGIGSFLLVPEIEGGMGPEAGEEKIAHGVVVPGYNDVAGFEKGFDLFDHFGAHALAFATFLFEGLTHFRDSASAELEEVKHDFGVAGGIATEE